MECRAAIVARYRLSARDIANRLWLTPLTFYDLKFTFTRAGGIPESRPPRSHSVECIDEWTNGVAAHVRYVVDRRRDRRRLQAVDGGFRMPGGIRCRSDRQ